MAEPLLYDPLTCSSCEANGEACGGSHDHPVDNWDAPAPCPTCLLVREEPDEPIEPGDYHTVDPTSPNRCPRCGLVPARGSEGARRVAAAREASVR